MISRNVLLGLLAGLLVTLKIETTLAQEKPEAEILRILDVVVSATRLPDLLLDLKRVPAQVRVTTEEEIESSGAKTVPEVIQYQPGITQYQNVGNAFESSLDMRGFSGEPVSTTTVILDGVRVNNPDFNIVNFDLLPVDDLERIEVVPGTASVFGKNALAGVVNLQTKRGGPVPKAKLEVAGGSFGHQRYRGSVGGPVGDFDYYLGFTQYLEEGFRDESDADVRRLFAKVGRRI
ncbi:MAG: TonB-dependent receptor, partial [Candidatus Methylomirabilales bacterium]